jgi:hypothetical protein
MQAKVIRINQAEWESSIKKMMVKAGWTCDVDSDKILGFVIGRVY